MTPLDAYHQQCDQGMITKDVEQLTVMCELQRIYYALLVEHEKRANRFTFWRKPVPVNGLYVWGSVGIGKTFLMDCFYECIPFQGKMRMHFHQFMKFIHLELKNLQGKPDPIQLIADNIASQAQLLCFDELFVTDITDAMLLGRLFHALVARGVCLVATSNVKPDDLYKRGLQREQFLPAIALLKQHTTVLHVPSTHDYRMRHLKNAGVFHTPNDDSARHKMEKTFAVLTRGAQACSQPIDICGREVAIRKQAADVIWFDFNVICRVPRSQQDYLAIAEKYKTVFISDVPMIPADAKDMASLFIRLVDVLYDARVRLVLSSTEMVEKIYSQGLLVFEYARTCSRLKEMQSDSYFSSVQTNFL